MGLGGRLALAFAAVVGVMAIGIGSVSYVAAGREFSADVDRFLTDRSQEIASGVRARPDARSEGRGASQILGPGATGRARGSVAVENDAEVQIIAANGVVTVSSGLVIPVDQTDLALVERNGAPVVRTVEIDGEQHRVVTRHIRGGGAVQVARSLDSAQVLLSALRIRLMVVALAFSILAAVLGWLLAQRITSPLRALSRSVETVASTGDLDVLVEADGDDEVGRLSQGFDRMLGALRLSREQQHRLVQDAAHELRTPLTSATANVALLARTADIDPGERTEILQGVLGELGELNMVVTEIVELATDSHDTPELAPCDLGRVAAAAVRRFESRSDRPVTVNIETDDTRDESGQALGKAISVHGDHDSLVRAASNLLSNAAKYSPSGSPIVLDVTNQGWLWVSDRGAGIPPEEREQIFERFYRRVDDRSKPGSGLGLAIVARIVAHHQGEVRAESASEQSRGLSAYPDSPGAGARVGFRIPLAPGGGGERGQENSGSLHQGNQSGRC